MDNTIKITKLDTQMKQVCKKLDKTDTKIDRLEEKIDDGFKDMKKEMSTYYVRREEFTTVRSVVYGMVGMILTGFLGSLIYIVFK